MFNTGDRPEALGNYIVEHKSTVRAAAEVFGISKSTVHSDVTEKLKEIDPALWQDVREVLDYNKAQRHIRGGMATREKYLERKKRAAHSTANR